MPLPDFVSDPNPEIYLGDNYIVLDFETDNEEKGSPHCDRNDTVLACYELGPGHPAGGAAGAVRGGCYEQQVLVRLVEQARFVVAHNAKFELGWLVRAGLDLRKVLPYCTMLGEYVIAGNRKEGLSLDATAERYLLSAKESAVSRLIKAGVSPRDIPMALLLKYCQKDVALAHTIFLEQRRRLKADGLLPVAYCRNLVTPVLVDIESRGMCLDRAKVEEAHSVRSERFGESCRAFEEFTGGINPRSAKQLRGYLYEKLGFKEVVDHRGNPQRTAAGAPRTDKNVIAELEAVTPEQKEFKKLALEVAKQKKPVENLEKMKEVLDRGERLVYAGFNQSVTQTHRLSSTGRSGGFQFHNFDRAFKPLFTARESGWLVVEADAPQLEFRVAAFLGRDDTALRSIEAEEDIHAFTASVMNVSRQEAKAHTFKPLYGGQSGTPKQKRYYQAFREKYTGIYNTQVGWTHEVLRTGKLETPWGLKFYFPGTVMKEGGYITNTPSIFNYPVQSFATADIIPLTLVLLWHQMEGMEGFLVNTIHDSIVAEIPPKELDKYRELLVGCFCNTIYEMVERLYGLKITVPLGVGIKQGQWWGVGEEEKHNGKVPDSYRQQPNRAAKLG